jgi:hypothetical protein
MQRSTCWSSSPSPHKPCNVIKAPTVNASTRAEAVARGASTASTAIAPVQHVSSTTLAPPSTRTFFVTTDQDSLLSNVQHQLKQLAD